MTEKRKKLALDLFNTGQIKFGAFKLKLHEKNPDAPLSPIYINLRMARSFPDILDEIVDAFEDLTSDLEFDIYADIPTAATPIVAVLLHKTRIPMISPKKGDKGRGIVGKIDGAFQKGQTALLIDDLVTQAHSKLEAAAALEENGLKVKDIVVLVDREQGGAEQVEGAGYHFHAVFKLKELLQFYVDSGKIDQAKCDETIAYLDANKV